MGVSGLAGSRAWTESGRKSSLCQWWKQRRVFMVGLDGWSWDSSNASIPSVRLRGKGCVCT